MPPFLWLPPQDLQLPCTTACRIHALKDRGVHDEGLHLLWDPTGKGIVQACTCEQDIQDQTTDTQTRNMSIFMTRNHQRNSPRWMAQSNIPGRLSTLRNSKTRGIFIIDSHDGKRVSTLPKLADVKKKFKNQPNFHRFAWQTSFPSQMTPMFFQEERNSQLLQCVFLYRSICLDKGGLNG